MKPQIIRTDSGEELVVVPLAHYEDLVARAGGEDDEEDAVDRAVYDARKAELAAGADARLPAEVSALMLRGTSLARALRKWRKLSQQQVAAKIGTRQGFVSDIESGRRRTAAETVLKLADIYDVPADWLMEAIGPRAA